MVDLIVFSVLSLVLITLVVATVWKMIKTSVAEVYELSEDDLEDCELVGLADSLQDEIFTEWSAARNKFGPFASTHEGFAVLYEEFDELKAEVWKNEKKHPDRNENMRKEAIQVGAMALRFLTDCCKHEERN